MVRYDGPLTPWMLASDGVVHSNCTTGIEAAVAGVPAIAYAPLDESDFPMLPNQVSQVVDSDEALVNAVPACWPAGRSCRRAPAPPSSTTSPRSTGRWPPSAWSPSSARCPSAPTEATAVRAAAGPTPLRSSPGAGPGLGRAAPQRRRSPTPPASPTLASQKFPPTPLDEVEDFLDRLRGVDPRLAEVRAAQVAPSLFTLEADDA